MEFLAAVTTFNSSIQHNLTISMNLTLVRTKFAFDEHFSLKIGFLVWI